jgi:hypothetical protein
MKNVLIRTDKNRWEKGEELSRLHETAGKMKQLSIIQNKL